MRVFNFCDLDEIIQRLNGGKIQPVGETNYDKEALKRQETIQHLTDILIDDILRVTEIKGNEASIEEARNKAIKWFDDLLEMLKENMPYLFEETYLMQNGNNHISGKENE